MKSSKRFAHWHEDYDKDPKPGWQGKKYFFHIEEVSPTEDRIMFHVPLSVYNRKNGDLHAALII